MSTDLIPDNDQKRRDLNYVMAGIPTSGLRNLSRALRCRRVIHGRFIDGKGNGCVFYWLSDREMVDRASRIQWTNNNPLFGKEHDDAIRRLIVGWDLEDPQRIVKGPGYDTEYPRATYALTERNLRDGLAIALRQRRAANKAENNAVQIAARKTAVTTDST